MTGTNRFDRGLTRRIVLIAAASALGACTTSGGSGRERTSTRDAPRSSTTSLGSKTIDVRTHGAKGDGRTDDREAIQSALDAVPPEGAVVRLPAGRYLVRGNGVERILTLKPRTVLVGGGREATTMLLASGSGGWEAFMEYATQGTDPGSLGVSGITFDMNTRGNPVVSSPAQSGQPRYVIRSAGGEAPRISIEGCHFHDCSNVNTLYVAGAKVVVRECLFTATGLGARFGWDHSSIYAVARTGGSIAITNNKFEGTSRSGASRTAIETHGGTQVVEHNVVSGYLKGMNITGIAEHPTENVLVSSNTISESLIPLHIWAAPLGTAKYGSMRNVLLRDNTAQIEEALWRGVDGVSGAYSCGIILDVHDGGELVGAVIQGNKIRWTGAAGKSVPPHGERSCGVTFKGEGFGRSLRIADNVFDGPPSAGVLLDGNVERCTIVRNTIVDPGAFASINGDGGLASAVLLVGKLDSVQIGDNRVVDTRRAHQVRQAVAVRRGSAVRRSRVYRNVISCRDGLAVPELDTASVGYF